MTRCRTLPRPAAGAGSGVGAGRAGLRRLLMGRSDSCGDPSHALTGSGTARSTSRNSHHAKATATTRAAATAYTAVERPSPVQRAPKTSEEANRARATTVWAVAIPLARVAAGTRVEASAASTPSVHA